MSGALVVVVPSGGYKSSVDLLLHPYVLVGASGFNPQIAGAFLQFFDVSAAPIAGDVPDYSITLDAGDSYSWCPPDVSGAIDAANVIGRYFKNGLAVRVSSTGDAYTPTLLFPMWIDLELRQLT